MSKTCSINLLLECYFVGLLNLHSTVPFSTLYLRALLFQQMLLIAQKVTSKLTQMLRDFLSIQSKRDLRNQRPSSLPTSTENTYNYVPGEFIVKFRSEGQNAMLLSSGQLSSTTDIIDPNFVDGSVSIINLNNTHGVTSTTRVIKVNLSNIAAELNLDSNSANSLIALSNISKISLSDTTLSGEALIQVIENYENDPHVEYAIPNYIFTTSIIPNDEYADSSNIFKDHKDLWGISSNRSR